MKRLRTLAIVWSMGLAISLTGSVASAQASAPAGSGVNVALIDISSIFKSHTAFETKTETLKVEVKAFENTVNERRKLLAKDNEKLGEFKSGSPQHNALQKELANKLADLQVEADLKRKEVLEREAKIYYETYEDIQAAVKSFANQHRIGLVLRYDSEKIDEADRASVLRGVNRAIVFQDRIDITSEILRMVNAPRQARRP
jgi:Skp family chaperone for outer membrane proteins